MTHDDDTWRATAASRPGYATYPDTRPGCARRAGLLEEAPATPDAPEGTRP